MQNEGRRGPICGHLFILFAWTRLVVDGPDTQCAKDCGPRKRTGNRTRMTVFTPAPADQAVFKDRALFFLISTGEESSQPTKHANKIIISIFLIMRPTILFDIST